MGDHAGKLTEHFGVDAIKDDLDATQDMAGGKELKHSLHA